MKFILRVLAAGLALSACKKGDAPGISLPPATQVGANTGGYLLNGQPIWATGEPGHSGILSSTKPILPGYVDFVNDSTLIIQLCSIKYTRRYWLTLFVRYHGLGTYQFNETTPRFVSATQSGLRNYASLYQECKSSACGRQQHQTDSLHTGTLTLNYVNRSTGSAAGLFNFTAYDSNTKEAIVIKQGRFDLQE